MSRLVHVIKRMGCVLLSAQTAILDLASAKALSPTNIQKSSHFENRSIFVNCRCAC